MAGELPPQVQDQLVQLQTLQQQLKVAGQQRAQIEFQVRDSERALEELEKVDADAPVFRAAGSLLIRTSGKDAVKKEVTDDLETLRVRLKSFEKQEARVKEKATELQSKVQAALKMLESEPAPRKGAKAA